MAATTQDYGFGILTGTSLDPNLKKPVKKPKPAIPMIGATVAAAKPVPLQTSSGIPGTAAPVNPVPSQPFILATLQQKPGYGLNAGTTESVVAPPSEPAKFGAGIPEQPGNAPPVGGVTSGVQSTASNPPPQPGMGERIMGGIRNVGSSVSDSMSRFGSAVSKGLEDPSARYGLLNFGLDLAARGGRAQRLGEEESAIGMIGQAVQTGLAAMENKGLMDLGIKEKRANIAHLGAEDKYLVARAEVLKRGKGVQVIDASGETATRYPDVGDPALGYQPGDTSMQIATKETAPGKAEGSGKKASPELEAQASAMFGDDKDFAGYYGLNREKQNAVLTESRRGTSKDLESEFNTWSPEDKEMRAKRVLLNPADAGLRGFGNARSARQFEQYYNHWLREKGIKPGEALTVGGTVAAMKKSLGVQIPALGMANSYIRAMDSQIARVEQMMQSEADKIERTGVRAADAIVRAGKMKVIGSGIEQALLLELTELSNEAGKLSTGSYASIRELSESAQKVWSAIHDPNLSFAELKKVMNETRRVGDFRLNALKGGIADMQELLSNMGQPEGGGGLNTGFGGGQNNPPKQYKQTAAGPNNRRIGSDDGNIWYDLATGQVVQ